MHVAWPPFDAENAKNRSLGLVQLIKENHWLINAYLVEFFTSDHWKQLPTEWQRFFESLSPLQCSEFVGCVSDFRALCKFLEM